MHPGGTARFWLPALALLAAAPAWANYSWGQMQLFRPGIQLGIVVLVLVTEILVIKPLMRMSWGMTVLAVGLANAASGLLGHVMTTGQLRYNDLTQLLGLAVPSSGIEFVALNAIARNASGRPAHRTEWAVSAVLVANLLSALVTFAYVYANYHGRPQPTHWREGNTMYCFGHGLTLYRDQAEQDLASACARLSGQGFVRSLLRPSAAQPIDVAPQWLPWAVMRPVLPYESTIPKRLDPPGKGRPMVWTGAPYFGGQRGVIFTDGSYSQMSERDFQKLGAVPQPPQVTLPPPEPQR